MLSCSSSWRLGRSKRMSSQMVLNAFVLASAPCPSSQLSLHLLVLPNSVIATTNVRSEVKGWQCLHTSLFSGTALWLYSFVLSPQCLPRLCVQSYAVLSSPLKIYQKTILLQICHPVSLLTFSLIYFYTLF